MLPTVSYAIILPFNALQLVEVQSVTRQLQQRPLFLGLSYLSPASVTITTQLLQPITIADSVNEAM